MFRVEMQDILAVERFGAIMSPLVRPCIRPIWREVEGVRVQVHAPVLYKKRRGKPVAYWGVGGLRAYDAIMATYPYVGECHKRKQMDVALATVAEHWLRVGASPTPFKAPEDE